VKALAQSKTDPRRCRGPATTTLLFRSREYATDAIAYPTSRTPNNMICGDCGFKHLLSSVLLMNVTGEKRWRPLGRGMALAAVLLVYAIIAPLRAAERDSLSIG